MKQYLGIRMTLWDETLWSPSYFAGSCGGALVTLVRQHIEQQQTPHSPAIAMTAVFALAIPVLKSDV